MARSPARSPARPIRKLADLTPDDRNANRGTERGLALLEDSLRRYGAGRSVLADRRGRVIAGNKTVERAAELGLAVRVVETDGKELVVVQRRDLDLHRDKAARELALADNRVAEVDLDWDAEVLKALQQDGVDLAAFFRPDELEGLLGAPETEGGGEDGPVPLDRAAELQTKWKTKRNQLWEIPSGTQKGRSHRLLCGDATVPADVERVVGGERPAWAWTDPPYGVEYVGKTKDALRISNDGAKGLPDLLRGAFACANGILADGAPIYVAHPAGALSLEFARAFVEAGWHWHQTLVWVKHAMVLGHSDYHYKHEPILYGWKEGSHPWHGGRDKPSVLEFDRPNANDLHPTVKPVELVSLCVRNSSKPGDLGYEPFAGSGTTFVAAEQAGRLCCGLELDPKYAAVVLERLAGLGLTPKLEAEA